MSLSDSNHSDRYQWIKSDRRNSLRCSGSTEGITARIANFRLGDRCSPPRHAARSSSSIFELTRATSASFGECIEMHRGFEQWSHGQHSRKYNSCLKHLWKICNDEHLTNERRIWPELLALPSVIESEIRHDNQLAARTRNFQQHFNPLTVISSRRMFVARMFHFCDLSLQRAQRTTALARASQLDDRAWNAVPGISRLQDSSCSAAAVFRLFARESRYREGKYD